MSANIVRVTSDYKIQAVSGGKITLDTGTQAGEVIITGDLTVKGLTTTVNSIDTNITDNILFLNVGESGNGITLSNGTAGIEIDRGDNDGGNAQFLFDETKFWDDYVGPRKFGLFTFSTIEGGINGIFTNHINTDGGNLHLINQGVGVITVRGTSHYENQVTHDDHIPNKKYVDTAVATAAASSSVGNVIITQPEDEARLTILNGKTLTTNNSVTFTSTDTLTTPIISFGAGGTVAYTSNKLNIFATTTSAELKQVISDETGSGSLVFASSPSLTTPSLGVATATTINKVTITSPATGSTLTIANGKTLTASNTLTFTGTDSSSVEFGAGGTVAYKGSSLAQFAATTSSELAGIISDETGSGSLVFATSPSLTTPSIGVATATSINSLTISTSTGTLTIANGKTLTASNTLTFTGTDSSSVEFGAGGTVAYKGSSLAQFAATTSSELAGIISDETGSGSLVFATSPSLTTPSIGVATATSINSLTISTSTGTLTIANGKTLTASNTLTFTGTDSSSVEFGAGGTVAYKGSSLAQFAATTSSELAGIISDETGSGSLVFATSPTISGHPTIEGVTSTGATGTGKFVFDGSPSLTTPSLGVATATSINSLTISTSTGTLTIANGKTLTASNTLTFTGTDTSSVAFGGGGTVAYTADKLSVFAATTSSELRGVISDETGTGALVFATSPTITTSLTTDSTSFNLINTTATTVNFAGAAETLNIGYTGSSDSSTFTQNYSTGYVGSGYTKTVNIGTGGDVDSITNVNIGDTNGGITTVNNKLSVTNIAFSPNFVPELTNSISSSTAIGLTSTSTYYQNLSGSSAQTYKLPDATTLTNGHTFVINNNNTAGNITVQYDDATSVGSVIPGANKIVTLYNNGTTNGSWDLHGFIPSNASWGSSVLDTNATTFSVLVAPTTMTFGYGGTSTATLNVATGATALGNTKTINLGTGGAASSTTNINVGSSNGGTITFNSHVVLEGTTSTGSTGTGKIVFNTSPTITTSLITDSTSFDLFNTTATTVNFAGAATTINIGDNSGTLTIGNPTVVGTQTTQNLYNTTATTVNFAGAATITNISDSGNINLGTSTSATTTVKVGGAISGNTLKIASTATSTINLSSDVTTGTINLFTDTTTGTINVGSTNNGIVDVAFTTESTSTTTGAVVVAGGVGIEKNLYVGESTTMIFKTTDPVADADGVTVYAKDANLGNTGLYYVNSTVSGELISKKKALAYSIVFG